MRALVVMLIVALCAACAAQAPAADPDVPPRASSSSRPETTGAPALESTPAPPVANASAPSSSPAEERRRLSPTEVIELLDVYPQFRDAIDWLGDHAGGMVHVRFYSDGTYELVANEPIVDPHEGAVGAAPCLPDDRECPAVNDDRRIMLRLRQPLSGAALAQLLQRHRLTVLFYVPSPEAGSGWYAVRIEDERQQSAVIAELLDDAVVCQATTGDAAPFRQAKEAGPRRALRLARRSARRESSSRRSRPGAQRAHGQRSTCRMVR